MRDYLQVAHYVYILPIFNQKDGDYELTISRGLPLNEGAYLSEDGEEYIKEREGRWFVPAIGACEIEEDPPIKDYQLNLEAFFSCYGIEHSETFFVGGQTTESLITAICFTDEGEKKDDGPYYIAMGKIDPNATTKEELEGAVFTYDKMKEHAMTYSYGGGAAGGANTKSSVSWIIILGITAAAVAGIILVIRKCRLFN